MTVTKTDFQRKPGRVFRRVAAGENVTVTEHGEAVAEVRPLPRPDDRRGRSDLDWLRSLGPCEPMPRDKTPYTPPAE